MQRIKKKPVVSIRGDYRRDVVTQKHLDLVEADRNFAYSLEVACLKMDDRDPLAEISREIAWGINRGVIEEELNTERRIIEGAKIEPGPRTFDLERRSVRRAS